MAPREAGSRPPPPLPPRPRRAGASLPARARPPASALPPPGPAVPGSPLGRRGSHYAGREIEAQMATAGGVWGGVWNRTTAPPGSVPTLQMRKPTLAAGRDFASRPVPTLTPGSLPHPPSSLATVPISQSGKLRPTRGQCASIVTQLHPPPPGSSVYPDQPVHVLYHRWRPRETEADLSDGNVWGRSPALQLRADNLSQRIPLHPSRPSAKCPCWKNFTSLSPRKIQNAPVIPAYMNSITRHRLFVPLFALFSGQLWETGAGLAR